MFWEPVRAAFPVEDHIELILLKNTRSPLAWQLSLGQNSLKLLENKGKRKADGLSNPDLEERRQGALCPREARRPGTARTGHHPLTRLPTQGPRCPGSLQGRWIGCHPCQGRLASGARAVPPSPHPEEGGEVGQTHQGESEAGFPTPHFAEQEAKAQRGAHSQAVPQRAAETNAPGPGP